MCGHAICKVNEKEEKRKVLLIFFSSQNCWEGHIAIQVELNQVLSSTCPVPKCPAQLHPQFILLALGKENSTFKKYEQAVIRSYVEESKKLTWCRNPQGCDQILVHSGIADIGTCTKCEWTSCFLCTFGEAKKDDERTLVIASKCFLFLQGHFPASCEQISKWVDEGGFYDGMDEEAKSKQLARVISKKCPKCNAPIEKNDGCLQ